MPNIVTNLAKETMISAVSGSDLKIALLDNIVLSAEDTIKDIGSWTVLSANEISGTNYKAGGVSLSGVSAYSSDVDNRAYFNGNSVNWTNATISAYGFSLYRSTSNLVINIVQFNGVSEGNPKISTNGTFSMAWDSNKILQMIG